jgi:hypothetical protein
MNFQDVFSVFMGVGGGGGAALIIKTLADRRKTGADADVTIADGALRQMERMDIEIARLDAKLKATEAWADNLSTRLREMADELGEYHRRFGPLKAA